MVQRSVTLVPATTPVTVVVRDVVLVMVAAPACIVQEPVPVTGLFAAMVKVLVLQSSWSGPAAETVGVALLVSTTSSALVHDPLVIVHLKVTLFPEINPVTPLVADAGVVTLAPLAAPMMLHAPVPVTAALPANVKLPLLHCSWSTPAAATVGKARLVSTTSSKLEHDPFPIVQRSVTLNPAVSPVTVVVAELLLVINAPLEAPCTVHVPVPTPGVFPPRVNVLVLHCSWSDPALAAVGVALLVSTTSSALVHDPLVIVHLKVTLFPEINPVTPLVADAGVVTLAPLAAPMMLHAPVPVTAALPANVKLPLLHCS